MRRLSEELDRSGPAGSEALRYLLERRVHLGVHDQSTAARWKLGRRIELHPRYAQGSPAAPYALSLIVHELQHIRQGPMTALSVYGELEAWQVQFRFLRALDPGDAGTPWRTQPIDALLALPLGWDRAVLRAARRLMQEYAGVRYRIDLLPLYPLPRELLYAISRRPPS